MSELEVALRELHKDTETWRKAAETMTKAAQEVAAVKDLSTAFGYLGKKAECDTTYATVNDTLKNVGEQASKVFQEISGNLDTVVKTYRGTEELTAAEIKRIKTGWHL
jgi:DNA repair ATPase RecN